MCQQGQPAAMFYTDDLQAEYERMKARGADSPCADQRDSVEDRHADDTCGNLIQVTQLMRTKADVEQNGR